MMHYLLHSPTNFLHVLIIGSILILTGCGGGKAPLANISGPSQAHTNQTVSLSGENSTDPEGQPLSYLWSLDAPPESNSMLDNTKTVQVSFVPDTEGDYTVSLIVNDGKKNSDPATHSISITTLKNEPPVAHISVIDSVTVGSSVSASGADSSDANGDALDYQWTLTIPTGSNATLSSLSAMDTHFSPDITGDYTLSLSVHDGQTSSPVVQRTVTAREQSIGQSITLVNQKNTAQATIPFSFATVFKKGENSANSQFSLLLNTGDIIDLQTDEKALHPDSSLRHAVFSGVLSQLEPQESVQAQLITTHQAPSQSVATLAQLISSEWDAVVEITIDNDIYRASAKALLSAQPESLWLQGPLVNEWLVAGEFQNTNDDTSHPHLAARFSVRVYGQLEHVWTSVIIENNWSYETDPKNITYDVTIKMADQIRFSTQSLTHLHHARWRQSFWLNEEPELHIAHDAEYLIHTGAIPNYDPALIGQIDAARIADYESKWKDEIVTYEMGDNGYPVPIGSGGTQYIYNKIGPMGVGFANTAMPTTGARPDIGPLPRWSATYILDQGPITQSVAMGMGDLAGSWPIHYRHKATQLPLSIDDYPYATNHYDRSLSRNPDTGEYEQTAQCVGTTADCIHPYRPDTAHQPSMAFVPYLLSGDHFYLEELHFWANYNFITMNPTYRGTSSGWFERNMQDRGQAWSMRTLGQAAYITPDDHPLKNYFESKLQANFVKYEEKYLTNPPNGYGSLIPNYSHPTHSPWMDDFFTWSFGYLNAMGYEESRSLLEFKSKFSVQRMGFASENPDDYCWIFAPAYHILIAPEKNAPMFQTIKEVYDNTNGQQIPWDGGFDDQGTVCASSEQGVLLGLQQGEMIGYSSSPTGFPSNLQIALAVAVNSGINGAEDAWQRFMNRTVKPDYSGYPNYAIVPRR